MNAGWISKRAFGAVAAVAVGAGLVWPAAADRVAVEAEMAQPVALAGAPQKAYLRVTLKGEKPEKRTERTPTNIAIVLDKSGSMSGDKIANAIAAAVKALSMLGPDDVVSVVAYDHNVNVLVPATKLVDKDHIFARIERIQAGGNTALFAGVSKGAAEVRKFLDDNRVNRVILLSDGLANVGPSSPGDLAELGDSLRREGISVTTIGLGLDYNEDLMAKLALKSDGNHMFARRASDLEDIFAREFGDVLSVVAQDVEVIIDCADGIRPLRVLGREAEIVDRRVRTSMNQLYGDQEKYVFLEVELPGETAKSGSQQDVAGVSVNYNDTVAQQAVTGKARAVVAYTDSAEAVEEQTNAVVMASVVEQIGVERNKHALELRDQGLIEEAKDELESNAEFLFDNALKYDNENLRSYSLKNEAAIDNLDDEEAWRLQRKVMREEQHEIQNQVKQQANP